MELTQLHNAKLQLEPNHNHVETMDPNNTGTWELVNTNAHQLDTANGIKNHRIHLPLQLLLTHATLWPAKKNKVATLSQHALGMTMRRTDQSNSSLRLSAIQSIWMDHKLLPCGLLASAWLTTLLAHQQPVSSPL